jgi:hypothetical protein
MDNLNFRSEASVQRIDRIQEMLRQQPLTLQEIADGINISRRYARDYVNYLQEIGSIYIADFRKGNLPGNCRHYLAMYRWGTGTDAAAPIAEPVETQDQDESRDRAAAMKKAKAIQPFRDWTAAWIPTR